MASKRDYRRYACREAADILDDAIKNACVWCLDNIDSEEFPDIDTHVDAVTREMKALSEELERRGQNAPSASQLLGIPRKT